MSSASTHINPAIIPLAVLCGGLIVGGVAAIYLTRKVARARLLLELRRAAEAKAAEAQLGEKPVLVDIFVGELVAGRAPALPWPALQPIATSLNPGVSSPHPHHTIEQRPGYSRTPYVDGNVLQVSVGLVMPTPPPADGTEASLEKREYCIGTADVVVCTLLGARQRLIGLN
ncbi:hypothetical protein PsYK624_013730 [Phanerochaete sordida]|uniref:Uncharacterized protein n=1 Tax=Phanerochaete sordida TaxID=48140 RepID=A0A9P3G047_9APHY|nr:hypothetical protein PsYK624_013730 [Phanerochaete sordida]